MIFHETALPDARLIEIEKHVDRRGSFGRVFCEAEFGEAGLETRYSQMNASHSARATRYVPANRKCTCS